MAVLRCSCCCCRPVGAAVHTYKHVYPSRLAKQSIGIIERATKHQETHQTTTAHAGVAAARPGPPALTSTAASACCVLLGQVLVLVCWFRRRSRRSCGDGSGIVNDASAQIVNDASAQNLLGWELGRSGKTTVRAIVMARWHAAGKRCSLTLGHVQSTSSRCCCFRCPTWSRRMHVPDRRLNPYPNRPGIRDLLPRWRLDRGPGRFRCVVVLPHVVKALLSVGCSGRRRPFADDSESHACFVPVSIEPCMRPIARVCR